MVELYKLFNVKLDSSFTLPLKLDSPDTDKLPSIFMCSSKRIDLVKIAESFTIKQESIFTLPVTSKASVGVAVPIPTLPELGKVFCWAITPPKIELKT